MTEETASILREPIGRASIGLTPELLAVAVRIDGILYRRHPNGGGWVADTAIVDSTAYVGFFACISGRAQVRDRVQIDGRAIVTDYAVLEGDALVYDAAWIGGHTHVHGNARISGASVVEMSAEVFENAWVAGVTVSGSARVYGDAWVMAGSYGDGDDITEVIAEV